MLSFESVKSRLDREQSLSFLEFNYMILQAYDFLELNRRYGCRVQFGGRTSGATSSTAST
jgi:tyrosyl-tRNA synthetase